MNSPSYFEIQVTNPEASISFYSAVFGWSFELDPHIPIPYYRIQTGGLMGGLMQRETPWNEHMKWTTNAFMCSMQVEDFDVMQEKILANDGMVAIAKFPVTGKCWQGYFLDNDRNVFGMYQVDESAK
jgi:predicted enzyme related to lactoylglutathione lyase